MRTLLVWLLLGLAPFTGVRLVCIERMPAIPAEAETAAHCDAFCPRPPARAPEPGTHETAASSMECLFVADGVLLMVVGGIAVMPAPPSLGIDDVGVRVAVEPHDSYLAPLLRHQSPPPRG